MTARPLEPARLGAAAPVLDFFSARLHLPPLRVDDQLAEDALCTRAAIALHPSVVEGPHLAAVLAHELFHFWSRGLVPPARWGGLPRAVPCFAAERNSALPSLGGAGVEEIFADLLAERLCAQLGLGFAAAYLRELPADLLEQRVALAARALGELELPPDPPLGPGAPAALEAEQAALAGAREALRRLSGFELAALALHEHRLAAAVAAVRVPAALLAATRAMVLPAGAPALPPGAPGAAPPGPIAAALEALDAPRLLHCICDAFAHPQARGFDRGPLWEGASPLEQPSRALAAKLRDREGRVELRVLLETCAARLASAGGDPR